MPLPLIHRAAAFASRTALVSGGCSTSYAELLEVSARMAAGLLDGSADLAGARVAFLAAPGPEYAAVQWGIWRAGGVAVPLSELHPPREQEYVVTDSGAGCPLAGIVVAPAAAAELHALAAARGIHVSTAQQLAGAAPVTLPEVDEARRAMLLYTSGTTSRPKGVVSTHAQVRAQVECLVDAWEWRAEDRILHVLPLHHVHGVINVLTCALWSGAACEFLPRFDATAVWERLGGGEMTLFMAVPTIYKKLIAAWEAAPEAVRERWSRGAAGLRLMVSGSAALPVRTLERWRALTGHTLLERYGMTEIGMALSNPLHGRRFPGRVGQPLPGVEVRLVDEAGRDVPPGTSGELWVRGPGVFREYWERPEATAAAFRDGWFRTGDTAVLEPEGYRILGRTSVDILKTGGYKVSALEVEEVLCEHPAIRECAVVGLPDPEWGERVCAAVVLREGAELSEADLRLWARERLAPYKAPTRMVRLESLPRNAMGKVSKPEVARTAAREAGRRAEEC